jgi:Cyanate lyase C-terminal domain
MFGDGIMRAIDFEIDIQHVPDPKGDRVQITYNGKFLRYRSGERTIGPGRSGLGPQPCEKSAVRAMCDGGAR